MAKKQTHFPTREEVLDFIRSSETPVPRRELARAFNIKGEDRRRLRELLNDLKEEGALDSPESRKVAAPGALPSVTVIEVSDTDEDGELLARPVRWDSDTPPPRIYIAPGKATQRGHAIGERLLARLDRGPDGDYEARVIRRLHEGPREVLGIYETGTRGGRLRPTDKRIKNDFRIAKADSKGAESGELVLASIRAHHARAGRSKEAVVTERLGSLDNPKALSLIAIHEHGIPTEFSSDALEEAEQAGPVVADKRTDLRDIPLITIDGSDAKDFDDAVFAQAEGNPQAPDGWRIIVAIADVAHYVRPDSALDRTARERGNSAYFPDRVVPMLPEALSNGWCSLRPHEERGCLAVEMRIDTEGRLQKHRFVRGIMRSAARLTYEQVEAAYSGEPDETTGPLVDDVIRPLYGAYNSLLKDRARRGTLDLDMPERQIVMDDKGHVEAILPRQRLESHKLIEEFMIAANVAAAQELEKRNQPCMYRVHDEPDKAKVEDLSEVLSTMDLKLAPGQVLEPKIFTRILDKVSGTPESALVSELILRAQSQAMYSPENIGHFGLALPRYAHFTSPIRRYADLLVHRALIRGLKLGEDGLPKEDEARFSEIAEHISGTERRAAAAERDAADRLTASFLKGRVGEVFEGRISGVTRFGLFVKLRDSGADGLVPISSLPSDYYFHDETHHCLTGRQHGRTYRQGDDVQVLLSEAEPLTGGLILQILEGEESSNRLSSAKKPAGRKPEKRPAARKAGTKSKDRKRGKSAAKKA
ncbi:ribonuclease R [Fodinicurvata sediminis]|uniref:ribonuclease R n=1 Tax=Fodinicurvata sediminis TaxID=1121832 RepID=UPI0003B758E6|nr:ribonuclease R [Fodinicurvata sediminis]